MNPFTAQGHYGTAWLAVRLGLLIAALFAVEARRERWRLGAGAVVAALFTASLYAVAGVAPFAVVCLLVVGWPSSATTRMDGAMVRSRWALGSALALSLVLLGAESLNQGAASSTGLLNPALETTRWLERDNLFRASQAAQAWVSVEPNRPGSADLVLARIEWELGHRDRALAGVRAIVEQAGSEALRADAAKVAATWMKTLDAP